VDEQAFRSTFRLKSLFSRKDIGWTVNFSMTLRAVGAVSIAVDSHRDALCAPRSRDASGCTWDERAPMLREGRSGRRASRFAAGLFCRLAS